ncbi:YqaJ viral recombinase family protein [Nitrosomonas marina]|uniref:Phage-related protein, predicted endonuclease n=1 Tax=Nitrosomonas marina TaxID=917 RepID=A0A1H8IXF6_9PROT|nr:YqaJ viral recombinase family protein [Nitrosomonas marina]SEN73264.1 Phage-related protein, predicted endonuclease [Nitrosomonas marina]
MTEMDRTKYIGGGDVAAILEVSPWKSQFQLYQEKIGEFQEEITPQKQRLFNRGKRWEPVVIDMLVDELQSLGHDVHILDRNKRYKDPVHNFIAAEIDLELIIDGEEFNGEMKTVHPFAAKDWGDENTDEIPIYYTAQCLHGQMVVGRNRTIVAALIGADDLRVHFVDRDEEMIRIMRQKEIEFWTRVQNRDAPEPATADDIKHLFTKDSGSAVEANNEIIGAIEEIRTIKSSQKNLEVELERLIIQVKKYMGDSAYLFAGRDQLCSWKNNKDGKKTDWMSAFYDLVGKSTGISKADLDQIINAATKVTPGSRVFRLE